MIDIILEMFTLIVVMCFIVCIPTLIVHWTVSCICMAIGQVYYYPLFIITAMVMTAFITWLVLYKPKT